MNSYNLWIANCNVTNTSLSNIQFNNRYKWITSLHELQIDLTLSLFNFGCQQTKKMTLKRSELVQMELDWYNWINTLQSLGDFPFWIFQRVQFFCFFSFCAYSWGSCFTANIFSWVVSETSWLLLTLTCCIPGYHNYIFIAQYLNLEIHLNAIYSSLFLKLISKV